MSAHRLTHIGGSVYYNVLLIDVSDFFAPLRKMKYAGKFIIESSTRENIAKLAKSYIWANYRWMAEVEGNDEKDKMRRKKKGEPRHRR